MAANRGRAALLVAATLSASPLAALPLAAQDIATSGVFSQFADRVIKIQVVEQGSTARSSIGSGFFVSGDGHVVTNYHVIAAVVHEPERHRVELVHAGGEVVELSILAIDVVHDLAVLQADERPAGYFALTPTKIAQGERLYSLGHPRDLGLSIVEGTYNGHLRHTLYPKIHFTGSINPGMSGGPAINAAGAVVGVNVSTAGNAVSFLVPIERALALATRAMADGYAVPDDLLAEMGGQIAEYQDVYLRDMFADPAPTVELGPFRLATEPTPFFRCWGDTERSRDLPYETVYHHCSTDDYILIASDHRSGTVRISHEYLSSDALNRFQFHSLLGAVFGTDNTPSGMEEHVTSWRCATRNVRNGATPLRSVLCIRRYQKIGELYDAVLKVAVLGEPRSGVVSTLTLTGVTYENVRTVTARYLERISWR
jgi:serine protease Do